jgi:hypothetical protein
MWWMVGSFFMGERRACGVLCTCVGVNAVDGQL